MISKYHSKMTKKTKYLLIAVALLLLTMVIFFAVVGPASNNNSTTTPNKRDNTEIVRNISEQAFVFAQQYGTYSSGTGEHGDDYDEYINTLSSLMTPEKHQQLVDNAKTTKEKLREKNLLFETNSTGAESDVSVIVSADKKSATANVKATKKISDESLANSISIDVEYRISYVLAGDKWLVSDVVVQGDRDTL